MARRVLREDRPQGRRVLRVQSLSRWGFDSHWYFSIELPVEGRVDKEVAVLVARVTARAREAGLNRMDEVGMGKGKNSLCSWWTVADVNQDLLQVLTQTSPCVMSMTVSLLCIGRCLPADQALPFSRPDRENYSL